MLSRGESTVEEPVMFERVGVCSWSLRPTSIEDLISKVQSTGVSALQLALDPIRTDPVNWPLRTVVKRLSENNISLASVMMSTKGEDYSTLRSIELTGGVRMDATWRENLNAAREDAEIADQLGVDLVSFHAGFMPHDKK